MPGGKPTGRALYSARADQQMEDQEAKIGQPVRRYRSIFSYTKLTQLRKMRSTASLGTPKVRIPGYKAGAHAVMSDGLQVG